LAYKKIIKEKNVYYCSKEECDEWNKRKDEKDNTFILIYEIFGRRITNTILFKEIQDLANIYTYSQIFAYLKENENQLSSIVGKDFKSEFAQIRYFTAILKNSLADFTRKEILNIKKQVSVDVIEMKYKPQKCRRSLAEIELEG